MRHAIESAPRDGQAVILENDSAGTYDVAHWSDQVGRWVAENGEPSKVTPTHWHPIPNYFAQEHDESSTSSELRRPSPRPWWLVTACTVALIAAALTGVYFGFERKALLPGEESRKTELSVLRQQPEAGQATAPAGTQQAVQAKQAVETSEPPRRQSLENESPREVLANELSETRRAIAGIDVQLQAEAANSARSLDQERQKTAAPAQEAAAARQELTTGTDKHRQALDEERARGAALASELVEHSANTRCRWRSCARRARKRGSSGRRKPRTAHNRSNRSGKKRLPSRGRPRMRGKK